VADVEEGQPISIENLVVHVMAKGNFYHLRERQFYSNAAGFATVKQGA
jgi:hypothetical protein